MSVATSMRKEAILLNSRLRREKASMANYQASG
jgi:hypothetical protein